MKHLALCIGSSLTASLLLFGGSSSAAGYDEDVMHNFLGGCMKAALANNTSPGYASRYCHCLWDAVTKEMTFEDFAMADRGEISSQEAGFDRIVTKCGGNADKLPEYAK